MKKCPYCREDIVEDALKCRYCGSTLISLDTIQSNQSSGLDKVTYVVDSGLLRFGKFVAASLAIFLIIGAYLFGFKLDDAVEKVQDSQAEIAKAQASLRIAQVELEQAKSVVDGLEIEVRTLLDDARTYLGEIRQHRILAEQLIGELRVSETAVSVQVTTAENLQAGNVNAARSPSDPFPNLWAVGSKIQISFIDGTESQRQKVQSVAVEWLAYANVTFEFRSEPSSIRISFAQQGNWTYPGPTALGIDPGRPTMNLSFIESTEATSASERRAILHEFGHLLGLIHEFQNPKANLPWNRERVYAVFTGPPNYWSPDEINRIMIDPISSAEYRGYREFDRQSVMNYDFAAEFFFDWIGITPGDQLSESDKKFIALLYPG